MNKLALLIVLFPVFMLHGCTAATLVSTATVITKAATDSRNISTQISDSILKLRINIALAKDKQIKQKARIRVITYQGKILLIGQAPNINIALRAQQIIMSINGITQVFNEVRHSLPISLKIASHDIWITTKIFFYLLSSHKLKSSNIKVITENSEVFLLGLVTAQEGRAAAEIASLIKGVRHVTTCFTYIN